MKFHQLQYLLSLIVIKYGLCEIPFECDGENFDICTNDIKTKYKNLVVEGGGAKAISHIGALKAFKNVGYYQNDRYLFENVSGTSAGCLISLFVALDIDPLHLEQEIYNNDILMSLLSFDLDLLSTHDWLINETRTSTKSWYHLFMSTYNLIIKVSKIIELWSFENSPGLSTDEKYLQFIKNIIFPLSPYRDVLVTNITFEQLYELSGHRLTCYATRLKENTLVEFSVDKSPHEYVFKATYASITIPGLFKPICDNFGFPLVDGGILNNFPIYTYDSDDISSQETLGLSIRNGQYNQLNAQKHTSLSKNTDSFHFTKISTFDYTILIYSIISEREIVNYMSDPVNKNRVIYLDSPLKMLDFNMNPSLLTLAINRAYFNTILFLNKHIKTFDYSNLIQIE